MIDHEILLDGLRVVGPLANLIKFIKKDNKPIISIKHLIVKSDHVIEQILNGEFSTIYKDIHLKGIYLHENEISTYLKKIHRQNIIMNSYDNWDETPVCKKRDGTSNMFEIKLKQYEFNDITAKYDKEITGNIIKDNKLVPSDFCRITYYFEECGGSITENIEFRPIWFSLLCIENMADEPIEIDKYCGEMYFPNKGLEFRKVKYNLGESYERSIPSKILKKAEIILIPEYILLAPIDLLAKETELQQHKSGEYSVFDYHYEKVEKEESFYLIGPSLNINKVFIENKYEQVNILDLENMLTISESFMIGSCPHIIGYRDKKYIYIKDVLSKGPESIRIENYEFIIIAEIENETTLLEEVCLIKNDIKEIVIKGMTLRKGNIIIINNIKNNEIIQVSGKYFPNDDLIEDKYQLTYKFTNLRAFLSRLKANMDTNVIINFSQI